MVEIPIIGTTEPAATVRALRDAAPAGASPLTVEWDGLLCVITMTRPAVRNAVDLALALEIEKAVDGRTIEQPDAADVRTLADGWAYARFYESTARRNAALPGWLHFYNHHRAHSALGGQPPVTRLTNLPGHHT